MHGGRGERGVACIEQKEIGISSMGTAATIKVRLRVEKNRQREGVG